MSGDALGGGPWGRRHNQIRRRAAARKWVVPVVVLVVVHLSRSCGCGSPFNNGRGTDGVACKPMRLARVCVCLNVRTYVVTKTKRCGNYDQCLLISHCITTATTAMNAVTVKSQRHAPTRDEASTQAPSISDVLWTALLVVSDAPYTLVASTDPIVVSAHTSVPCAHPRVNICLTVTQRTCTRTSRAVATSAAARWPARTPPSMNPCPSTAASVPAQ